MPFHNLQEAEQKRKEIKICRTVTWTAGSKERQALGRKV